MRLPDDPVVAGVAAVTVVALMSRLVGLGSRPFHWEEARVGYWTLQLLESGVYQYRPVAGGPLLYLLTGRVFETIGVSDTTGRLAVATLGGTLPVAALLFRTRLRDSETLLLAVVLAAAPPLVYYSRFLRGDVPVAAFTLVAFGASVSWVDRERPRFLYLAAIATGCAFGTSGFAVATVAVIVVASVITFDQRRIRGQPGNPLTEAESGVRKLWTHRWNAGRVVVAFLAVWVILFTPRGRGLLTSPVVWSKMVFGEPVAAFLGVRIMSRPPTEFIPVVGDGVTTVIITAGPLLAVALLGFLADRYRSLEAPRSVVAFSAIWGGLGLITYPLVAGSPGPWITVHMVTPLAIPSAVGLSVLVSYARRAVAHGDSARLAVAVIILASVGIHSGLTVATAYGDVDSRDQLTHPAQPVEDLDSLGAEIGAAVRDQQQDTARIIWVGESVHSDANLQVPPLVAQSDRTAFARRLPLAYYIERTAASVSSSPTGDDLEGDPTVVIATPSEADSVATRLPNHRRQSIQTAASGREFVIFIR